ncbi:MAG: TonB-dependent receptor [Saprospiraceae bacterium]|nr:TonB-dependent receptor [Saprospiraceae bacterium]
MNYKYLLPLTFLFPVALFAQQQDSLNYTLPDIVISENRLEIPFSELSNSVEVITAKQIEAMPGQSLADILHYVSGVDVRQRGIHGVQADISIRGGTFDQTLILLNGVKLSDSQTGHHAFNLPVDMQNIERIEVLKGPGARVYGQNAFAGAINIVTKNPEQAFVNIELQGGQYQTGGLHISASVPKINFKQYFSFGKDFSQGYRYNTDYDINNAFYQTSFKYINTEISLIAGYTEREFGANGFYASPSFADQYEEIQTSLVSLELKHQTRKWTFKPRLYWRRNQDEYIFVRSNPSLYRNLHIGNTLGAEFHVNNQNKLGQSGLGAEWRHVQLQSNNLGNWSREEASLFAEHRFEYGRFDITPGILLSFFTDFGAYAFPGVDLGVDLFSGLRFFANAGQTYRVPTYTDLYYQDPANIGNPDLKPESAFTFEAGFKQQKGALRWQASYFQRDGKDLIDWTKEADTLAWQPRNFANIKSRGFDASLHIYFPLWLGMNSILQRFDISYIYMENEVLANEFLFSRYALENLRHQFIAGFEYKLLGKLVHRIQYRYTDRVELDNYTLLDTRLSYQTGGIRVFLEASNLLDTQYTETSLVPMPGRWIQLGLNFRINL